MSKKYNIQFKFEPRDLWIGIYWNTGQFVLSGDQYFEMYICIVPLFPIRIRINLGEIDRDKESNP